MKLPNFSKPLLTVMFWSGCLAGFIFQSMQVCEMYFEYQTRTSIEFTVPVNMSLPSLSICFRYVDVLNRTNHERYGLNPHSPRPGFFADWNETHVLTVGQIFELTRPEEDIIEYCYRRSPDMLKFDRLTNKECNREVNTTKFYMQEYMCYMFSVKSVKNVALFDVAHSVQFPLAAFGFVLKDVPNVLSMYVIVHTSDALPYFSRNFGKQVNRKFANGIMEPNNIFVNYRYHEVHRLPPPYDSMCTMERSQEVNTCVRNCSIERTKGINRFPFSEMTTNKSTDVKHVNIEDLKNNRTRNLVREINDICNSRCTRLYCHLYYITTNLYSYSEQQFKDQLSFRVMIPDTASTNIQFLASWSLLDFFVYMCSSFGLWFGLSIASLNPMKVRLWTKAKSTKTSENFMLVILRQQQQINFMKNDIDVMRETLRVHLQLHLQNNL